MKGLHRQFSEIESFFENGGGCRNLADALLCNHTGFMEGFSSKKIIGYTRSALRYLCSRGYSVTRKECREIYETNFFVLKGPGEARIFARELGLLPVDIRSAVSDLLAERVYNSFEFTAKIWQKLNELRKSAGFRPLSKSDRRILRSQVLTAYNSDPHEQLEYLAESLRFLGWELLPYVRELHRYPFAGLLAGTDDGYSPLVELYAGLIVDRRMTKAEVIEELTTYDLLFSDLVGWPELAKYGARVEEDYFLQRLTLPVEIEDHARMLYLLKVLCDDCREWNGIAEQIARNLLSDSRQAAESRRIFWRYGFDLDQLAGNFTDTVSRGSVLSVAAAV